MIHCRLPQLESYADLKHEIRDAVQEDDVQSKVDFVTSKQKQSVEQNTVGHRNESSSDNYNCNQDYNN